MRRPITKLNTSIHEINDIFQIHIVLENILEMSPSKFVRTWGRQVVALSDRTSEFYFQERIPGIWSKPRNFL